MIYLLHFAFTWFLIGLSWFVLVVHYPLFQEIPQNSFASYVHITRKKNLFVVLFPIFFEALSGVLIFFKDRESSLFFTSLIILAFIWISMFFSFRNLLQLEKRKTEKLIYSLLSIHLIRTLSWSFRGAILLLLFQS